MVRILTERQFVGKLPEHKEKNNGYEEEARKEGYKGNEEETTHPEEGSEGHEGRKNRVSERQTNARLI